MVHDFSLEYYVIDLKSIFYCPVGRASWFKILGSSQNKKIKAEFANLVSARPAHSGQLSCTWKWVSRKEGVEGGTSNLVDIGISNVAWFDRSIHSGLEIQVYILFIIYVSHKIIINMTHAINTVR